MDRRWGSRPTVGDPAAAILATVLFCGTTLGQTFTDVTGASGISYVQNQIDPSQISEFQAITGGAAAGDFDGDGWVDLYVTRIDQTDILYRNTGDGKFQDVTSWAFGTQHLQNVQTNGPAWGDIDNDGDLDLYVTSIDSTRYHLFVNDGQGQFSEQAIARGADLSSVLDHYGYSSTFGDYDRDGFLDLYVTEWGQIDTGSPAVRSHARLLRNVGRTNPGHFTDVTDAAGVNVDDGIGFGPQSGQFNGVVLFSPRFSDMDGDGNVDLAIAGDFGTSRLFWNNGDGTFRDGTEAANVGTDENGMGSAVGDYDGDGDLDWFVTSIYEPSGQIPENANWGTTGNRLFRNNGDRTFADATDTAGVRDGGWGWGAAWLDYDNDGDLDLVMTNGHVKDGPEEDHFNNDPMRLWRNDGQGTFTEVAASEGVDDKGSGKGLLTFDYDRDGDLDIFVVNNAGQPVLYRNDTDGHYLQVKTDGVLSNADGIGAQLIVTPSLGGPSQIREVNAGSHFLGQSEFIAHFGLGDQTQIDLLTIQWPSGTIQSLVNVSSDQLVVVTEPTVAGDADDDGDVDLDDLVVVSDHWLAVAGWDGGDFDGTGDVTIDDLRVVDRNWLLGALPGQPGFGMTFQEAIQLAFDDPSVVPEPTSAYLVILLGLASWRWRLRGRTDDRKLHC